MGNRRWLCLGAVLLAAQAFPVAHAHTCAAGVSHSYKVTSYRYEPGGRGNKHSVCAVGQAVSNVASCYASSFTFTMPNTDGYKKYTHSSAIDSAMVWANGTSTHSRYRETLRRDNGDYVTQTTAGYIYVDHMCSQYYYFLEAPGPDLDLGASCSVPQAGNPVSITNGNKYQAEADLLQSARPDGQIFERYYNGLDGEQSALGKAWRHSYTRQVLPRYASVPAPVIPDKRSRAYYDAATACTSGWPQIRSKVKGLELATASYQGGVCVLSIDGIQVSSIVVSRTSRAPSAWGAPQLIGFDAISDEGRTERFNMVGADVVPDLGTLSTLAVTASGYQRTGVDGTVELYDSSGKLAEFTERGGFKRTVQYDAEGLLSSVTDPFGRLLNLNYDGNGRLASVYAGQAPVAQYGYDSNGRLASVVYPDGAERNYVYEDARSPSALTAIVDENRNLFAKWTYDARGRALSSEHAGGAELTTFSYGGDGSVEVTNAAGASRTYTFAPIGGRVDGRRLPVTVSAPGCGSCSESASYAYDASGNLISETDFNQSTTTFTYDLARNLPVSKTEAVGTSAERTTTTQWHPQWRLPVEVTEAARRTQFEYDPRGNLTRRTVIDVATGVQRTTEYGYTIHGQIVSVDGPIAGASDSTVFRYDASGDLIGIENALGHVTAITDRDLHGNPTRVVDPNGAVTLLSYDLRQRLTAVNVGGQVTAYVYDPVGQLTRATQPDGTYVNYEYDQAHRLVAIEDSHGNRVVFTLNALGKATKTDVFDPLGTLRQTQAQAFDTLGRLTAVLGAEGQSTQYDYDAGSRPVLQTRGGLYTTYRAFDALDRLIQETDATGGATHTTYNALDQLVSVTDPKGLVTQYTRNAFGDVVQLQSPDSGTSVMTYDGAGNVLTRLDAKGQLTHYTYDALNRIKSVTDANNGVVTYTYDQGSFGVGRLSSVVSGQTSTSWTYDAWGRVISKAQTVNGLSLTTGYGYDAAGHLSSQTLPSGQVVAYTWNAGRVTGITVNGTGVASNMTYGPFGQLLGWSFANGEQIARTFDQSGRMTGHGLGSITYDSMNRITALSHGNHSSISGSKTYDYDGLDRLVYFSGAGVDIGYSYDANGNRTQQTSSVGAINYAIDQTSNRIASLAAGSTVRTFTYDANGSLVDDGITTRQYDALGRLAAVPSATYSYNGLNQRTAKTVGSVATTFFYDEQGRLLGEYDAAGTLIQETVWLGDMPLAALKAGYTYYIHADHLNTPRQIDDAQGNPVWAWDTVTFGASAPNQDPMQTGTPFVFNPRFPGQYYDAETGLHQNWHRDYDPLLGRYVQSDPIGLLGGLNTYAYVGGNPISLIDPLGLDPVEVIFWNPVGAGRSSMGHVSERIGDTSYSFAPGGMDVRPFADYLAVQADFRGGHGLVLDVSPEALARMEAMLEDYNKHYNYTENNCTTPIQDALGREFGFGQPFTPTAGQRTIFPIPLEQAIRNNFNVVNTTFYPQSSH